MGILDAPAQTQAALAAAISAQITLAISTTGPDRQAFATAGIGTWTNPSPSRAVPVLVRGTSAGAGGGSGRRGAAGSLRTGGAGGAPGVPFVVWLLSTDLPATVPVTIGAGGAGGVAITTDDTDGTAGGNGGSTYFGAAQTTYNAGFVNSGTAGGRGGNSTGAATGGANSGSGPTGGSSSATGGSGSNGVQANLTNGMSIASGGSGAAGAGLTTGNAAAAGGTGGGNGTQTGGSAGAATGAAGTAAPVLPAAARGRGGGGGGGGGSSATVPGGAGGAGADVSGGGGGGAASVNGQASGPGGPGGTGYLEVVTFLAVSVNPNAVVDASTVATAVTAAVTADLANRSGLPATTTDEPNTLVSIRDATGHRTWMEARKSDGGLTKFAIDRTREGIASLDYLSFVADGDSMTGSAFDAGTPYPDHLSTLLGKTVANTGQSGALASEIGLWAGGLCAKAVLTGNQIPATTATVAVTITLPDSGPTADRTWNVKIQGVPCVLAYINSSHTWTVARRTTAGSATLVPNPAVVIPDVSTYGYDYVHILWAGRNNVPKSTGQQAILDTAAWYRQTNTRFLLISICNTTTETSATTGYTDIVAVNDSLRSAYPREYVGLRSRMINEGLALAGISATANDISDIANDCIPRSLLFDGMHFNESGRTACAAIIKDELTIRGLA